MSAWGGTRAQERGPLGPPAPGSPHTGVPAHRGPRAPGRDLAAAGAEVCSPARSGKPAVCPFKGPCLSWLCWHLKDCGGRKLSGMSHTHKKCRNSQIEYFRLWALRGASYYLFLTKEMFGAKIQSGLTCVKFSWNLNSVLSFYVILSMNVYTYGMHFV